MARARPPGMQRMPHAAVKKGSVAGNLAGIVAWR